MHTGECTAGHRRDAMGDELSSDMGVVMRHAVALQTVDIVGQMLGHIANVVRADNPRQAIDRIGMCELKAKLSALEAEPRVA